MFTSILKWVTQALKNLVYHAVKYSFSAKEVLIRLGQQGDYVTISVTDYGRGFPRDEQSKIFDKSYRVNSGLVHDVKGSGLGARVEAVQRRGKKRPGDLEFYEFGDVRLDFRKHEATKGGRPLELTVWEFNLLKYFIQHKGEVVTRDQLINAVWGYDSFPITRTVDTHLGKLRAKIEDAPNDPRFILTAHRLGYKFIG